MNFVLARRLVRRAARARHLLTHVFRAGLREGSQRSTERSLTSETAVRVDKRASRCSRLGVTVTGGFIATLGLVVTLISCDGSVITVFDHLSFVQTSFDWSQVTRMAVILTAALAVLGVAGIVFSRRGGRLEESWAPRWLPPLVCAGSLAATVGLWQALVAKEHADLQRSNRLVAARVKSDTVARLESQILALVEVARRSEAESAAFPRDPGNAAGMERLHGLQAVGEIDPSMRVRRVWSRPAVYAEPGSSAVVPLERFAELARTRAASAATPFLALVRDGQRLVAVVAHVNGDNRTGFFAGVWSLPELLDTIFAESVPPGYSVSVHDGEGAIYSRGHTARGNEKTWSTESDLDLHGLRWRVQATPTPQRFAESASSIPHQVLVVGLLMASLVVLQVHLARGARRRTRQVVAVNRALEDQIAERKRAEKALAEREANLRAANKELEAFSYSVSHDLRAPLRSIDGFSQALFEDYWDSVDETGKGYLRRIRVAAQRMGELIDALLRLSRVSRSELHVENTDLSALAQTIVAELQQGEPDRHVEFLCQDGIVIEGDKRLLRVVLENLLGNAWKFTGRRGLAKICFGANGNGEGPACFVRDNGAGFDMAYAQKLFGAFQRLHGAAEFPGTGIGLATVQRIIHRHGGQVWAEGAVDHGATFYFTLGTRRRDAAENHPLG